MIGIAGADGWAGDSGQRERERGASGAGWLGNYGTGLGVATGSKDKRDRATTEEDHGGQVLPEAFDHYKFDLGGTTATVAGDSPPAPSLL